VSTRFAQRIEALCASTLDGPFLAARDIPTQITFKSGTSISLLHLHNRRAKSRFGLLRKNHRRQKFRTFVKYWKSSPTILKKAGWSWGCVSTIDSNGQTIWIADAHRDDGKRYGVHADEKLSAFVERSTFPG
jgi:hypothetical protein